MILPIVCSAILFYLAFPNFLTQQGYSFCAWIFAIPLFYSLEQQNLSRRILVGFLFGMLANLAAVNWMIPYHLGGYLFLSFVLAIQAVIFASLYRPLSVKPPLWYVPAAWVVSEWIRKLIMMGESWDLAHSQAFHLPLLQIANVLGSSAVSFVLVLINYSLYRGFRHFQNIRRDWLLLLGVLLIVYGYGSFSLAQQVYTEKMIKVCAIQPMTDFSGDLDDQRVERILQDNIDLSRTALNEKPDLIIWPETSVPEDVLREKSLRAKISAWLFEAKVPLLMGTAIETTGRHNSAVYFDRDDRVRTTYHKRHLIPLSEYIPEMGLWKSYAAFFGDPSFDFIPGSTSGLVDVPTHKTRFGIAICSEDNIASVFRRYADQGAAFVVVLLNNGWFSQTSGLMMHGQHSMIRAVENGIPVLRVANTGWSVLIDRKGQVSVESLQTLKQKRVLCYKIPLQPNKTWANILGDTFCYLCLAFVIMFQFFGYFKTRLKGSA